MNLTGLNSLRSKLADIKVQGVFWLVDESLGVYEHFPLYLIIKIILIKCICLDIRN